ncbi:hypothetical protein PPACK8108_LOCUS20630 [Phakopsora pachyrhizi]|uniref:SNF2 N-terminal domain-containing protein n=1 Tax=Phakopsora pachyrhizi TaxID=170000 RepID=A0AAV0BHW2_PHAPC|nr:hypothetical protein PPACK8108_LOCUS20630 [Phakopsora pachyrhizi]
MTSSTGAFQGKLWKICVVDLQQGLACLCWAGELSPRQSAARAGAARARLGLAGSRAGRENGPLAWLRQNGQAGARLWAGKAGWGRLWLGYGQAWLWAGKAGWGRLWLGYGQVRQAGARLWAGKAGWGRLRLGYGQAVARSEWAGWGRLGLGYRQAGARLWAGKAGWGRLWLGRMGRLGQAGARLWAGKAGWGRLRLGYGQVRQAGAGCGSVRMGRLGQAGARLWAGKAGWGRLGLGPNGLGPLAWLGQNGQAGAGLWAGKAGWGRLGLGYGQAVARLWAGKAGWGRLGLGYRQAGARLWAGKAGWGRLGLGYGQVRQAGAGWGRLWLGRMGRLGLGYGQAGLAEAEKKGFALRHVVDQNSTGVDRVMLISKGTHQGREQAMVWLTAEYQEQMQAQKVIARERGKGQSDRRAGHTHTQAEGNRATESIKTEGRPRIEENPPKGKTPPGKETSVKDGFKGKTPLAGKALGLAFLIDRESFSKSSYSLWRKSPLGNCTFMWTNLISQEEIITTNEEVNFQPLGSLLADDMGLGKTLQAIALISSTLPSLQQYKDEEFINISSLESM